MTEEQQLYAYKELRNNGQAFFIDNYEDADRIIIALEKIKALKELLNKPIASTYFRQKVEDILND